MDNGGCVVFNNIVIALYFVLIIIFSSNGFFVDCKIVVAGKNMEPVVKHKNTVKTIESDDGDVIDCVDIYKQPAFDHPLLKNHTIQLEQWAYPSSSNATENIGDDHGGNFQSWHKNGECPEGTIPILREGRYDRPHAIPSSQKTIIHPDDFQAKPGHEYAQVTMPGKGGTFYGAHADINVWKPTTLTNEISVAQIWLVAGPKNQRNTLEVGWIVGFLDGRTKSFIYWTADGYQHTGCFNLQCPGFVQVNKRFAIGARIQPLSVYNGKQQEMRFSIYKNTESGHWWLSAQGEAVGYWPDTLFSYLKGRGADYISWGGEITNRAAGGRHTSTQMGSGHFPSELFGKASYFRNLQYLDLSGKFKDAEKIIPYATKPHCYDVLIMKKKVPYSGTHFYFGGPGYSPSCQT